MSGDSSFDIVVRNTASAVLQPLTNGIGSLNSVYETLIYANMDFISNECSHYSDIRHYIVRAERSLQKSENAANSGLRSLDASLASLIQDSGRLEQKKRNTKQTLDSLLSDKETNKKLLRESNNALDVARDNLNYFRRRLEKQKERKENAAVITGIGIGVSIIPVFGWVVGPAMAIGGMMEMDKAQEAINDAADEVDTCKSKVEKYKGKISNYESRISETKQDISRKSERLDGIRRNIENVKQKRENLVEFQYKVRNAVHLLSVLSGRVSVTERLTQNFILRQPVMMVMEEVMQATMRLTGNSLLCDSGMRSLVNQIRANNQRLAAICASQSEVNDECASFY